MHLQILCSQIYQTSVTMTEMSKILPHGLLYISFHVSSPTAMAENRIDTTIHGAIHTKKNENIIQITKQ